MPAFVESPESKAQAAEDLSRMPATELPEIVMKTEDIRNGANGHTNGHITDPFKLSQEFAYTPRRIRVITIGAGVSGIMLAYLLQKHCENVEHIVYEKNGDIGGTWLEVSNWHQGCFMQCTRNSL